MTEFTHSPYQSPTIAGEHQRGTSVRPAGWLATVGLGISVVALGVAVALAGLGSVDAIDVAWDSRFYPGITLLGCLPLAFIGLVVSMAALIRRPNWRAAIGITLAVIAIPVCLAATLLLVVIAAAKHPI